MGPQRQFQSALDYNGCSSIGCKDNCRLGAGLVYMKNVNTAKGPIDTSRLGVTLMHEHIFVLSTEINQNYPESWGDEEMRVQNAVDRLGELKRKGVDSLVDLTVVGIGRYIPRIQRIAAQVGLNIIVATGLYTFNELPMYLQFRNPGGRFDSSAMLVEMFLKDIREGIADTGVKAAILKCATDRQGVTPGVELVLRAVARAHQQTGVPISTHTHAGSRNGLDQQRIFAEEGVDLSRVVIGHCGDTTDFEYLEKLLEKGSYLGMDRFGIDTVLPFNKRVDTVASLCRRGYCEKIVLSHDAACYNDWFQEEALEKAVPNWNYFHILNDVVPALKDRGVTENQLHTMLVENPRRIFGGN
jgi:phosphotriesterase-related protein